MCLPFVYGRSEEFFLCTTSTVALDRGGYFHAIDVIPLGKGYMVTIEYEAGLVPKSVWTLGRREKSHHCQGWNHNSLAIQV